MRASTTLLSARRSAGDHLLGMLLAAGEDGVAVDPRQVRDEVMSAVLLAGHETSAAALTWTWHLLARRGQFGDAVSEEAATVLGDRPLSRVVRFRTARPHAGRGAGKHGLPRPWAGSDASQPGPTRLAAMMLQPAPCWLRQPLARSARPALRGAGALRPGRSAPGVRQAPYTYFLGGGPRACIGSHFALTAMVVALAVLVSRVHLSPAPQGAELPARTAGDLVARAACRCASSAARREPGLPSLGRPRRARNLGLLNSPPEVWCIEREGTIR